MAGCRWLVAQPGGLMLGFAPNPVFCYIIRGAILLIIELASSLHPSPEDEEDEKDEKEEEGTSSGHNR